MNRSYIINDVNGNLLNGKYPPNKEKYGNKFGGYKTETEILLFHDFAVLSKDVSFLYNGNKYYFYRHNTPTTAYNAELNEIIEEYPNELELIEKFSIGGRPFIELIDEICNIKTYVNVFKPHSAIGPDGYPYNSKYPPQYDKYGYLNHGYKDSFEETLFYDFGVQNYDLYFKYKDKEYFVLNEYNYVAVCDENYTEEYEVYANEMEFIENFKIDGKPLIELIDKLEEVDPM
jgi:hypothetical protein